MSFLYIAEKIDRKEVFIIETLDHKLDAPYLQKTSNSKQATLFIIRLLFPPFSK